MTGLNLIDQMRGWSDYASLKKQLESRYGTTSTRIVNKYIKQTGTAGAVELEDADSIAIGQIGKTEVTLILVSDTNDNAYDTHSVTVHYLDADGAAHTVTAAYNTADTTTEVAVCSDFYCFDPAYGLSAVVSSVAVQSGDNVYLGTTGVVADPTKSYCKILAAATSPIAANIRGVGTIYGRTHTNHNDADGAILYLEYSTPWGTIGYGHCTINTTDGTTETRFFRGTASTTTAFNDTITSGAVQYVDDYYRTRRLWTNQVPTANCHEFLVTDDDCANVDGSGGDVYGVIKEGLDHEITTRWFALAGCETYLARICGDVATNTTIALGITFTPFGSSTAVTVTPTLLQDQNFDLQPLWRAAPLTDIYFTILGNSAVFCANIVFFECGSVLATS